jgi:hypothetical protein
MKLHIMQFAFVFTPTNISDLQLIHTELVGLKVNALESY